MKINEIVLSQLDEGPHDPHIFKAIFLSGGPGSGKSYVARQILQGYGLKFVNSDDIYEYLANKNDLDISDPSQIISKRGQEIRGKAKDITNNKKGSHLRGRLGMVIDGTGKNLNTVSKQVIGLRAIGYDCMMVMVNTDLDVAQERNAKRARRVPTELVTQMWNKVQSNLMKFQQVFGASNFHIVDNSGGLEDPDRKENFKNVEKAVRNFLTQKPTHRAATQWIKSHEKRT